jgi:hypothetical protein
MSIPLPPIPDMYIDTWPLTPEKLRARDLEVARVVLEAAAKMIQNERLMFSDEEWRIRCELAESLRALEFTHDSAALGDKT